MTDDKPQKPSKEYLIALVGEAQQIVKEYVAVTTGKLVMTDEEKAKWNTHKDFVESEIKRVRGLI